MELQNEYETRGRGAIKRILTITIKNKAIQAITAILTLIILLFIITTYKKHKKVDAVIKSCINFKNTQGKWPEQLEDISKTVAESASHLGLTYMKADTKHSAWLIDGAEKIFIFESLTWEPYPADECDLAGIRFQ